jgi:hypothetical protein
MNRWGETQACGATLYRAKKRPAHLSPPARIIPPAAFPYFSGVIVIQAVDASRYIWSARKRLKFLILPIFLTMFFLLHR